MFKTLRLDTDWRSVSNSASSKTTSTSRGGSDATGETSGSGSGSSKPDPSDPNNVKKKVEWVKSYYPQATEYLSSSDDGTDPRVIRPIHRNNMIRQNDNFDFIDEDKSENDVGDIQSQHSDDRTLSKSESLEEAVVADFFKEQAYVIFVFISKYHQTQFNIAYFFMLLCFTG